jgi:hypothetical protein
MSVARYKFTATTLPNGLVLLAGGYNGSTFLSRADLYDPVSGDCAAWSQLGKPREWHTATLLANGAVLLAGGYDGSAAIADTEVYY